MYNGKSLIAFLGYVYSPKWFNISIFFCGVTAIFLIIVFYTLQYSAVGSGAKNLRLPLKSKVLIYPVENIKNKKYNKLNNKSIYFLNNLSKRRYSTTQRSSSLNKSIETPYSERLNIIIQELGLNPPHPLPPHPDGSLPSPTPWPCPCPSLPHPYGMGREGGGSVAGEGVGRGAGGKGRDYIYENLDSENIRKQILSETKGLSGIYMIVNKITKDYYIGSAATNRFYARFSNHLIYFRGAKLSGISLSCLKLSNSGNALKLMVPNSSRKVMSGWSKFSGMVTSHKINESKMGYRGSKSLLETSKVKEQRVDGSYLSRNDKLRYTLMGFERNYQVGLLSN